MYHLVVNAHDFPCLINVQFSLVILLFPFCLGLFLKLLNYVENIEKKNTVNHVYSHEKNYFCKYTHGKHSNFEFCVQI